MAYNDSIILMFEKIRALTEDFVQSNTEVFTYESSKIFTLAEPRIISVIETLFNGVEPQSGQSATFDATTNDITIVNDDLVANDVISIKYTFSQLSDSELFSYIRAALVWLSIYDNSSETYKLSTSGLIIPTPSPKTIDLVCIIAAILIKPDYISYKTSNMSITYPTKITKEEKIQDMVQGFKSGIGVIGIIEYDTML